MEIFEISKKTVGFYDCCNVFTEIVQLKPYNSLKNHRIVIKHYIKVLRTKQ